MSNWCSVRFAEGISTKSLHAMVFMQTVFSTVIQGNSYWVCDEGKLDKYKRECDISMWLSSVTAWQWAWLDFLDLTWCMLSSRLSRTSLDLNLDFWVNLLLLLQVRQRPLYTNPQATTMQDDAICLVGSWVSWMTKHKNKKYKKTMTNQWVSQAVTDESEVTKNRMWFVMMGKD